MGNCIAYLFWASLPPGISYDEAKRRCKSFDLVYFCHLGTWTGPFVAMISGKMVTHMGIMYREPSTGELYVLESVRSHDQARDVASGNQVHEGVRMVRLQQKLDDVAGRYYVCVQRVIMEDRLRDKAEALLPAFVRKHVNIKFESHVISFVSTHLNRGSWWYAEEDTATLFCSELAALTLRECGLLLCSNVSRVWHTDFWCNKLQLVSGAHLSIHKFLINLNYDKILSAQHRSKAPTSLPSLTEQRAPSTSDQAPTSHDTTETGEEMVARIRLMESV